MSGARPQLGKAFHLIADRQRAWARRYGVRFNSHYRVENIRWNLFRPLRPETHKEYERADGNELEEKLRVLYSSSALVANVFNYWRDRPGVVGACFNLPSGASMSFEKKHPLFDGILPGYDEDSRHKSPNVDVELDGPGSTDNIVLECKFTEPFVKFPPKGPPFSPTYFRAEAASIWAGMDSTRSLAVRICDGSETFGRLEAPQLIKTALACQRSFGTGQWRFVYLWFQVLDDAEAAEECRVLTDEFDRLRQETCGEIPLEALTWQEVFRRLEALADPVDSPYLAYLRDRYFPCAQ